MESDYDKLLKSETVREGDLFTAIAKRITELKKEHYEYHKMQLVEFCRSAGQEITEEDYRHLTTVGGLNKPHASIYWLHERGDMTILNVTTRPEDG